MPERADTLEVIGLIMFAPLLYSTLSGAMDFDLTAPDFDRSGSDFDVVACAVFRFQYPCSSVFIRG